MRLRTSSHVLSWFEVVQGWQQQPRFRSWFSALLARCPLTAFRWETPPLTETTASDPFELVMLESASLARDPDPTPFSRHFADAADSDVVVFPNLGHDAVMVVPCPVTSKSSYGHLAAFVRSAPEGQQQALWKAVGTAAAQRISSKPVWVSTAGGGVAWLHVRLDDRPKYYGFRPYIDVPAN